MPVDTWLHFILGFMIIGAIAALEIKDILSSIIAIGIVGLGLSLAFLYLQAPDLALVQFVFEILCVIILIRAFTRRGQHPIGLKRDVPETVIAITILSVIFVLSIFAFKELPSFGKPIVRVAERYLAKGAQETGSANLVTSIILDYRAYDTLGEVTVLFTSILGAFTVLRTIGRKHRK
ncbi:MAG: hypothetical protein DRH57_03600 [Candidatus Cloacimonadota bacterium]|nr:MAG: hypothetical protein DRH57_03600 [Candidatus Cloacimonadota bacterium]